MTDSPPRRRYTNRGFIGRTILFAALTGLGVWGFGGDLPVGTVGTAAVVALLVVIAFSIMQATIIEYGVMSALAIGVAGLFAWQGVDGYLGPTAAGSLVGALNGMLGRISRENLARELADGDG